MDTTRIDLNLLLTLEALLAEQNVTKAAVRLHLSQPAVSAQLNRLRDLFDDPLLIPARRGMTPTAKALELIIPVRESLEKLRHTLQSHKDFHPERAKLTVAISCTDYTQAAIVMPLVLALRKQAPGMRIAVRPYHPVLFEQQLASGEVDIAIASQDASKAHLRSRHLFDETYVLIGRRDHPALKENLTIEEFVQLEHVIVSPTGGSFTSPIDDALATFGHKRNVVMSAATFMFVPQIVSVSDLVALVPRRLLLAQPQQLTVTELPWLAEQFDVSLVWHERSHGHAGHRWVRELIAQVMSGT